MFKWLRDGIEGRDLKATLRLYLGGLLVLAPAAAFIGYLFGTQAAFQATPLLVLILVGAEYGLCYPEKLSRLIPRHRPDSNLMPSIPLQEGGETPKVEEAMRQALSSPLMAESPIAKAHRVLINVTGGADLSAAEVHKAVSVVHEVVREDASIIFGSITNESVRDEVRVTIIAADFGTDTTPSSSKQLSLSGKCIAFKYTTGTILIDYPAEPRMESPSR